MEKKKLCVMRCGIFLIFFILKGLTVFSQTYAIKGVVVSADKLPIEFANVVLSDIEGKILKGTITDSLGRFNLVLDDNLKQTGKIMTVSYLGYESYVQPVKTDDIGIIILLSDNTRLNEVVVTARRSPYTMKGTTLAVNVQNSILKTAGNAGDVLKQLPLISIKDGNVSVFGKGKTLVYIDNRELRSIEELQKLSSSNIKKIDIVTVPGAQYSASTGAVVRIYTVEPAKGISGLVHAKVQRGADLQGDLPKTLFTIEQNEDKPITISRFTNVDRFKKISIAAIWDPAFFKVWNPEVEVGIEKQFFKIAVGNTIKSYNRPCIYVGLFNVLRFQRNWSFVIQAKYRTSGNSGVSYENSTMYVDAYIQKSFFDRTMSVKVGAENIFNTYNDCWTMVYKNVNYVKSVNNDNRFAYISFTYNLHKAKKYTGKGTRNSEQKRLTAL